MTDPRDLGIEPFDEPAIPRDPAQVHVRLSESLARRLPARAAAAVAVKQSVSGLATALDTLLAEHERIRAAAESLSVAHATLEAQHAVAVQRAELARADARRAWCVAIAAGALLAIALLR